MKIAIITNSYPTVQNPFNQVFVKNMEIELRNRTIETEVCYNKIFDFWGKANSKKGLFFSLLKVPYQLYSIARFLLSKKGRNIKVLYSQGIIFSTFFSVLVKKITGIPVVCYVHGGDLNSFWDKENIASKILRYSLDSSDYIIVNSQDIYEKVRCITFEKKISIISPGVDTRKMRKLGNIRCIKEALDIPENKFVLISVGNAIERKGFDILLESIKALPASIKHNLHLILITEGPCASDYKSFIDREGLQDIVEVRKKVSQDVLNQYYNCGDVFIFPSREEPLGLVGIEAMAAGTVVIGSNVGGIKEVIADGVNGFLFESEDSRMLMEKILHVYNNKDYLSSIRENMKESVEKHSLSNSGQQIAELLQSVAKRKRSIVKA